MKIPANVVDQLINGAQSDIRQVLNMLSTWKLSNDTMDFDESKSLFVFPLVSHLNLLTRGYRAKMNEKYAMLTPFNITSKLLGPYTFSATSRETLSDKMELYFHDHSFVPLFMHVRLSLLARSGFSILMSITGELSQSNPRTSTVYGHASGETQALGTHGQSGLFSLRWRSC